MRPRRTLENIVETLMRIKVEVRCGGCCHDREPCDKCKEATRRANGYPIEDEEK